MKKAKSWPLVSFLIPTLNAAKVLEGCLISIRRQNYPPGKVEIIIADGGSTDETLAIGGKYGARIFSNPLKTGEAGKAVALNFAKGDLVALVDSDNILPGKNWLRAMVAPFKDREIIGSEPWKFSYRASDGFIDRYCALLGANDPLCFFLGNYDRLSVLTGKWTDLPLAVEDQGDWLKISLDSSNLPTIGANGTILRREVLLKSGLVGDYLFDIDVIAQLASKREVIFAKVKEGIIHLYCGSDVPKFVRKQNRRITDYLFYQKLKVRSYPWQKQNQAGIFKFLLFTSTILPLLYQSFSGFVKKRDLAWFFHPLACWLTLFTYGKGLILAKTFGNKGLDRKRWRQ